MSKENKEKQYKTCGCDENCTCGCNEGKDCKCEDEKCNSNCNNDNLDNVAKESEKAQNYLDLAQRIKAEFENYKKRNASIASISYENGVSSVITKLLPALDSFNQAKSNISDKAILSGIDLIYNQIMEALYSFNVEKINAVGLNFDPNLHNAVLTGNDNNYPDGTILEEFQAGYKLGDKIIRHSVVKVNKLS